MSKALKDLEIGAKVRFGKMTQPRFTGTSVSSMVRADDVVVPITWEVAEKEDKGIILFSEYLLAFGMTYDNVEPNNTNTAFQTGGNPRYKWSNIDQWLNSTAAAGEWYSPQHEADTPPNAWMLGKPGFLNGFSERELGCLVGREFHVKLSTGTAETVCDDFQRKVFLPTVWAIGGDTRQSGDAYVFDRWGIASSSTVAKYNGLSTQDYNSILQITGPYIDANLSNATDTICVGYWSGNYGLGAEGTTDVLIMLCTMKLTSGTWSETGLINSPEYSNGAVCPAIYVSPLTQFSDEPDADGYYTLVSGSGSDGYLGKVEEYTDYEDRSVTLTLGTLRASDYASDSSEFFTSTTGPNGWSNWILSGSGNDTFCINVGVSHISSAYVGKDYSATYTFTRGFHLKLGNCGLRAVADSSGNMTVTKRSMKITFSSGETKEAYATYDTSGQITSQADEISNYEIDVLKNGTMTVTTCTEGTWTGVATGTFDVGYRLPLDSDPITFTESVPVTKTRSINTSLSSAYIGIKTEVPRYEETTTTTSTPFSVSNYPQFFTYSTSASTSNAGTPTWKDTTTNEVSIAFGNYGVDRSTSNIVLTAKCDLTGVIIRGAYYTETDFDKITLAVAGTTVLNGVSGLSSLAQRWSGNLTAGQTIELEFVKDSSRSVTGESSTLFYLKVDPIEITTTSKTQVGTEIKEVARKLVKGYIGDANGKAREFWGAAGIQFTGEMGEAISHVDSSGKKHTIYPLLTSGTLTLSAPASYWMCGGGAGGHDGVRNYCSGGGGGGGYVNSGTLSANSYVITIGAGGAKNTGGSSSTIGDGDITANGADGYNSDYYYGNGGSGGSGGGGGSYCNNNGSKYHPGSVGTGAAKSTYPFNLTTLYAHSPGGGAGSESWQNTSYSAAGHGGNGGTNGSNGGSSSNVSSSDSMTGGTGGERGGGNGSGTGYGNTIASSGSFYGAGGGGGYRSYDSGNSSYGNGTGGTGYQGIAYIAIPPIITI